VSGTYVRLEHEAGIVRLTITRADKLNALDRDVLAQLGAALLEAERVADARCLILTGDGKAFVAGADIAQMRAMSADEAREFSRLGHRTLDALERLPYPAIAAVNGFALGGGCEIALACDFIHCSEKAKLGQPEVKLGVIPGFGGTQRLARRVGVAKARELVYTGAVVDAAEALRIGLADAVHPPDQLLERVGATAKTIAEMSPVAVRAAKKVIREGEGRTLPDANALEIEAFAGCFTAEDQREGMAAFLEKRPPKFSGR